MKIKFNLKNENEKVQGYEFDFKRKKKQNK